MMELNELRNALNWNGVFQGRDCPIIVFDEAEAGKINGLKVNDKTFYLGFPEYIDHPISFMVTRGPEKFQYWVLGDRLHRVSGPASIILDTDSNTSHQTWYRNGLKHNTAGPAEIIYKGHSYTDVHPRTQADLGTDFVAEEWNSMECYWFEDGIVPLYPKPFSMMGENGHRIFQMTGSHPMLSDFRGEPCFEAGKLVGNWARASEATHDDPFRLRYLVANDYYRHYDNGEPGTHGCKTLSQLNWVIQGETQDTDAEKREQVNRDLFELWNIWEGPLFANEQETVFAMGVINS